METPKQPTLEDDLRFCRGILQTASQLGDGQVCCVWFMTSARKNHICDLLTSRYLAADLERIEINLYN